MTAPGVAGWCATMPVHRRLLDLDPAYAPARAAIEDFTYAYGRRARERRTAVFPTLSCDNGPDGDMFVNYMDYTDDRAMVMFTTGQAERMDACLAGPRATFAPAPVPP